jgi:hypothetical protein
MALKILELPNRIRKLDEKSALHIDQNFEEFVFAIATMQAFVNANGVYTSDGDTEFLESDAISYGAEEPTD